MRILKAIVCCLLLLASPCFQEAQAKNGQEDPAAPLRNFVQQFYDWYVPLAAKDNTAPAWDVALKRRGSLFSPGLARALQSDSAQQAGATGKIVGLDFDPFLNSQDPAERYEAGRIVQRGGSYLVEVRGARSGKKSDKPDVVPELTRKNGRWQMVAGSIHQ